MHGFGLPLNLLYAAVVAVLCIVTQPATIRLKSIIINLFVKTHAMRNINYTAGKLYHYYPST